MSKKSSTFSEIIKFNPYHDSLGRFTGPGGYASFTVRTKDPKKQHMADMAMAREKERAKNAAAAGPAAAYGLKNEQHEKLERLVNSSIFAANDYRKEIGMSDEAYEKYKSQFRTKERREQLAGEKRRQEREEAARQKAEMDERIKNELPGLDQNAIRAANGQSFFDHGSVAARDALRRVDSYRERNKIDDSWTDEQKAYAKQREEEYKQLITDYYNDSNRRFADNPGWHVAGPANYNTRAFERKQSAADKKAQEYEDKLSRFEENTKKQLERMEPADKQIARWRQGKWKHGETVSPDDPLATQKQQAKVDYLKESNEKAKAANRYWNKNHDMTGFDGFSEETNQKLNAQFSRIYQGQIANRGLESVRNPFSTNSAEIRAAESRLKQLQDIETRRTAASTSASAGGSTGGGTSFKGGTMKINNEINRLQLVFDGKPSAEVRAQLKANGFRWSPTQGAWQRQNTPNAERAANRIMQELNKSYPERITPESSFTFRDALCIQSTVLKTQNTKHVLFVGLKVAGIPRNLLIDGGEKPEDLHVTLLYGYFEPRGDEDDTAVRIQSALEKVKPMIPDSLRFDRIGRFAASESSDGKDVIYARVAAGQLEKAHESLVRELKRNGLKVEKTFADYNPHMTLAYIDRNKDYPLDRLNVKASVTKLLIGHGADCDESKENTFTITKTDNDKRLVFGWANIAIRKTGEQIKDWQRDMVDPEDLEEAVYKYVLNFRDGGEEHVPTLRKKCRLVESVMFTEEKLKAMGIPKGTVPLGWWIGFYVDDDEAWEKIKSGHYKMFSIEGKGKRQVVDDD